MFDLYEFLSDGVTIRATRKDGYVRIIDKHETELWVPASDNATAYEPPPVDEAIALAQARAAINAERDRRLGTTFTFAGKSYDCDTASLARITGAATLAGFAMGAGAAAGNLRWHGGAADFTWIAADNTLTTMDAQTCFAFGNAAATNQSAHIFAGRTVKAMDPIPADYTDDKYWP